jgi:hypothetical protein
MAWMIIRVVEESGLKNIIKNGEGLTDAQSESRLSALQKRCPMGQRFERLEYDPANRDAYIAQEQILEFSEFV